MIDRMIDPPAIVRQAQDASQLVAEAKAARAEAEAAEEYSSPHRWREADAYKALALKGWGVRRIADECGTNRNTVSVFCRIVSRYRDKDTRPRFWDAYAEITGEKGVVCDRTTIHRQRLAQRGRQSGCELIRTGDFNEVLPELPDGSVDLIFTDPPYKQKSLHLYRDLAQHAARILKEGGSLICYAGHYAIPVILPAMMLHLRYWWAVAVRHSGPSARLPGKWVFVSWKPMLWFVKGRRRDREYVDDLIESECPERIDDQVASNHDWEQGEKEAHYLIERLTVPGELVLDPMCGSGTTCLAALKLKRATLGIEINPDHADVARGRIDAVTEGEA
jgi:DNA methylase/Putative ATPase subunit of terminase (gpP-like)